MWNGSIKLVTKSERVKDEDGFGDEIEELLKNVPANFTDLTRNDEIMASQKGYTADQNIEIMECNYNGEKFLYDERNGDKYEVKRTFHKDKSMNIILQCERRERGAKVRDGRN